MRQRKYRAWYDGKMIYPVGALCDVRRFFRVIPENAELMDFTGFADKNLKEIYDGDILQDENGDKYFVKWLNGAFLIEYIGLDVYCELLGFSNWKTGKARTFENNQIIGNIYENPELLNA